ncbi:prephenate dehydrogenase/arogenate dehydrogenase family protein [bacterium]|nr:prephenate dehydrogenase/arogenate dehydrogenase family protein [bacterium]
MGFERAAIVGVGLIGGSLALAARAAGLIGEVVGIGRGEANLAVARARGICDRTLRDPAGLGPVDLVVLAVPVRSTAAVARSLLPHLRPGTLVTDVGSVKGEVVAQCEAVLPADRPFVGGHPIAGSERAGAAAADAALFRGAPCILTPSPRTDAAALARVRGLWEGVGARVQTMTPAAHDRALAWVSHLPHVVAYALVGALAAADGGMAAFAGGSWRDATRVAASPAELWRDILLANAEAVLAATDAFSAAVARLRAAVAAGDERALQALLEAAVAARRGGADGGAA